MAGADWLHTKVPRYERSILQVMVSVLAERQYTSFLFLQCLEIATR